MEQEDFEPLVPRETFDRRILRERDQGFESVSPPPTSHQDVGSPGDTISRPVGDFPGIGSLRAPRRFSLPAEFVTPRAFPPLRRALPNKIRRRRNRSRTLGPSPGCRSRKEPSGDKEGLDRRGGGRAIRTLGPRQAINAFQHCRFEQRRVIHPARRASRQIGSNNARDESAAAPRSAA